MKRFLLLAVALGIAGRLVAGEQVSVPWPEFKALFEESVRREAARAVTGCRAERVPLVYAIEEAAYRVSVAGERIEGEARVSGRIVAGDPAPIPLFGRDLVIAGIDRLSGGALVRGQDAAAGIAFLPDGRKNEFQFTLSFLARAQEDGRSRYVSLAIPAALRNSVSLALPADCGLMEEPGIVDTDGVYHFAATGALTIRYLERKETAPAVPVDTPPIVLEAQSFFVSFEENGNVLSVLTLDLPPEAGPRLKVKPVPDAEIWSLTVNGQRRQVYTDDERAWSVPLDAGGVSRVQLAWLCRGPRLGLHGRLEAVLPETGLPSRSVRVGIALPGRVQLLSLEGPLNPAPGEAWEAPADFVGKPHFFARSFYRGEAMNLAISYKEPADQGAAPAGAQR